MQIFTEKEFIEKYFNDGVVSIEDFSNDVELEEYTHGVTSKMELRLGFQMDIRG